MCDFLRLLLCSKNSESHDRCEKHEWKAWAKVVSVYDGDTVTLLIKLNSKLVRWRTRLIGYDAPELKSKNEEEKVRAIEAKQFLISILPTSVFYVHIKGLDKYGRLLIDPTYKGKKISDIMIEKNYGYVYNGGTKQVHVLSSP